VYRTCPQLTIFDIGRSKAAAHLHAFDAFSSTTVWTSNEATPPERANVREKKGQE